MIERSPAREQAGTMTIFQPMLVTLEELPIFTDFYRIITDFYRIFGLSWETSAQDNLTPEASKRSGSGRIEFSSKSTTFLM